MKMTRKKKIFIGLSAFLAVLLIGGYIFSKTAFFTEKIRLTLESVLRNQLGREVSVGEVSGNIFGGINIAGISVAKDEKLSDGKLVDIEVVKANYSLLSLLRWRFVIKSVKIGRPRIWLERDEEGKWNLPEFAAAAEDEGKKSRFQVLVSKAEIYFGEITLDDRMNSIHLTVHGINGTLRGSGRGMEYSGKVKAQKMEVSIQGISRTIVDLASSFEVWEKGVMISDLQLRLGRSNLKAKGELLTGASPQVSGELRSRLYLEDISEFLRLPMPNALPLQLEGAAEIYCVVSGAIPELAGMLTISIPTMHINDLEVEDVDAELKFTQDSFSLTKASATLNDGQVKIKGMVQLSDGKVSGYNGDLKLDRIDIGEIITALNGIDATVSGLLSGEASVSGTELRPGSMDIDAHFSMLNTRLKNPISSAQNPTPDIVDVGTVEASLSVKGESIALNVSRGKTTLKLDGTLDDEGDLGLSIQIDRFDPGEIVSLLTGSSPIIGEGRISAVSSMKIVHPAFRASMGLPPIDSKSAPNAFLPADTITDLRCQVNVDMPNLSLPIAAAEEAQGTEPVKLGSLTGTINLIGDRLRIDEMTLQLDESECLIVAEIQIKDSPLIDASLTVDSLKLENYMRLIDAGQTQNLPLQISGGLINGELTVHGEITDMSGRGEFSVTELSVSGRDIDLISVPIEIESSVLNIPNLVVSSAGEQITAACRVSPSGDYDLKINSSPMDLSKLPVHEFPITGTAQLSLSGSGNLNSPSIKGKLELDRLGYNGESFGSGECIFVLADENVFVDVSLSERTFIATLDASIQHPFPFNAIIQLGNINLEPVLKLAGIDEKIDLRMAGSIDLEGEGANLAVAENSLPLRVDATLQKIALDIEGHRWTNDGPVILSFSDDKLRIDSLKMEGAGGKLSVNGTFDIAGAMDLDVDARDFDLAVISEILELPKPVSGKIDCALEMDGNISSPIIALRANGTGLAYDQVNASTLFAQIFYREGMMEVEELAFSAFGGETKISASLPLELDFRNPPTPEQLLEKSIHASLDAENLDLGFIQPLVPQVLTSGGKVSKAHLEMTGQITQPKINGSLRLKDVYFQLESIPSTVENLNGNLSVQSLEPYGASPQDEIGMDYEVSLDLGWEMEKGKYDAQGSLRIPYWVIAAGYSELYRENQASSTEQSKIPPAPFSRGSYNPSAPSSRGSYKAQASGRKLPSFEFDLEIQNGQLGPLVEELIADLPVSVTGNFSGDLHLEGSIPYEVLQGSPLSILDELRGAVTVSSLDLAVNDYKIKNRGQANISFADRVLEISNLELLTLAPPTGDVGTTSIQVGSIRASGKVSMDEVFQVDLSVENLHPGLFSSLLEPPRYVSGKLALDVNASGKFDSPVITLSLRAEDLNLPISSSSGETRIKEILCRISYNNEVLNIEEAYIDSFGNKLDASGTLPVKLSLMPPTVEFLERGMDLKMFMDNFDLAFLGHFVDQVEDVRGYAKADFRLFGSIKDPRLVGKFQLLDAACRLLIDNSMLAQADIAGADIPLQQPIEIENIELSITMSDGKIAMDKTAFQIGDGKYDIHGELGIGHGLEPQEFDVTFRAFPAKLDPFLQLAGSELASRVSGEITVGGNLSGDFRNLRGKPILDMLKAISGEMLVSAEGINISAGDYVITNPDRIYAKFENGNLDLRSFKLIDKTAKGEQASSIAAFGDWEIGGEKMFDAVVNLDMGLVSELINQPDLMSGWLGFKVEGRGKVVTCKWPLSSEESGQQSFTIGHASIDRFEGTAIYQDQELRVEQARISSGENHFFISGSVPMTGKAMDLRFDGQLGDMSILSFVSKEITESSGKGVISATITGDMRKIMANEEPIRFVGFCSFDDLGVNFDQANIKFEDLVAEIKFDSASSSSGRGFIEAKKLRGKMNDGEFVLDVEKRPGVEILWDKENGYRIGELKNISITMNDFMLYQLMVYSVLFDGELTLEGKFDSPIIKGNIVVKQGAYIESMENLVQRLFATREIGIRAFLDYPLIQDLELDVDVQAPGNIKVNNSLVNVETEIAAKVRGSLARPIILARAEILEGSKILYLGREFIITSGEIRNKGDSAEINPEYKITAETELTDFAGAGGGGQGAATKVYMEMNGSLSEFLPPTFTVPGENLSQTDIISILTLGSTPEEFKALLTSSSSSSLSPLLMKPAKWYIESQAEKLLKMKEFEIQIDPNSSKEARLVMAKQVMADISVLFDVGYSGQRIGVQRVGLQYEMSDHIAIAGQLEEGNWVFDLKIKRDFP